VRHRGPWLVLAGALLVLAAVITGITVRVLSLERERVAAEQREAHEGQVRLALWRIDTEVAPLLSQEIVAVAALAQAPDAGSRAPAMPEIRARFVVPEAGPLRVLPIRSDDGSEAALGRMLADVDLWAAAPDSVPGDGKLLDNPSASNEALEQALERGKPSGDFYGVEQQTWRNASELSSRVRAIDDNANALRSTLVANSLSLGGEADDEQALPALVGGPARPLWLGDELVVVRRVTVGDEPQLHGSWIDWPRLRERLLGQVYELLPTARLERALSESDVGPHLLATLPVRLEPGDPPALELGGSPLAPSLVLGWIGALAAALAMVVVLRSALALSERRAAFVSAVTHELRTPLTTFRMYAEMLEEGMAPEGKRVRYLGTLRREADRLGELVENVLAYARIESDRAPLAPETLAVAKLVERVRERLEERSRAGGLELHVELPPALADVAVRVDPAAVEQILFNLVDNATKYAPSRQASLGAETSDDDDGPSATASRLELRAAAAGRGRIELSVRDHGPGIDAAEREAIFEPFSKARAHASGTQPGVGLGLALSRRLAQQLGGTLWVEAAEPGARFVLTVPRA
jgi:signal transduction histidine kinase